MCCRDVNCRDDKLVLCVYICVCVSLFVAGLCYMCMQFSCAPPPVIVQTCVQTTCYVYFFGGGEHQACL